ncbi:MAG: ribosome maturation factor RimM [Microcystaceae cyanobacterium]
MTQTSPNQWLEDEWLEIGTIVAVYGIQGEVKVLSSSDFPERFEQKGKRWLQLPNQQHPQEMTLTRGRIVPGKNLFIVKFAEIATRNQAETLVNSTLLIPKSDRLPVTKDEYHVSDLIDLAVYHQLTGELIGTVTDFYFEGNDLLAVKSVEKKEPIVVEEDSAELTPVKVKEPKLVLIPFVKAIVTSVDLTQKRIEINPPLGLLEL